MKISALAGGVGGAKLLVGLQRALAGTGDRLSAIVNTGDDAEIYNVHVSPDVDICTYWLAGIADTDRGWGIKDDTFEVLEGLRSLGVDTWFSLGDRDFATCLLRTQALSAGRKLTVVTDEIRRALGVRTRILPMSDDRVRTQIVTSDHRTLDFQTYFVKERTRPEVAEIMFAGMAEAVPGPGVLAALREADRVVLCPSNPIVSIGPILGLPGVREALRTHRRVLAVTPIVRGAALKGPADRMLRSLGSDSSASGVARLYSDFADLFVVDRADEQEV
ncbi:MAG: 2-phospho-L-lactate transferase, partial [Actinomycetota bacterium]